MTMVMVTSDGSDDDYDDYDDGIGDGYVDGMVLVIR